MMIVEQKTKKTNKNGLSIYYCTHSFTALPINFCSRYISFTDVLYLYFLSLWNQIHCFGVLIVSLSLTLTLVGDYYARRSRHYSPAIRVVLVEFRQYNK